MSANTVSAPTPQKLISRLNRSVGKIEGKRMREHMVGRQIISYLYAQCAVLRITVHQQAFDTFLEFAGRGVRLRPSNSGFWTEIFTQLSIESFSRSVNSF